MGWAGDVVVNMIVTWGGKFPSQSARLELAVVRDAVRWCTLCIDDRLSRRQITVHGAVEVVVGPAREVRHF